MGNVIDQSITDEWAMWNGDCLAVLPGLPDGSIHLSVYSPPFAGMFHYSSDERDLSNASGYDDFMTHYGFVVAELARATMPGRCTAVHCMDVPKSNSGGDALLDFPGDIIRLHAAHGFEYVARHAIWKEPLAVRNRTMTKDLTHQTVVEDAARAGAAGADYLLVFRRRGANPVPVVNPAGLVDYYGVRIPPADVLRFRGWQGKQIENRYSHWVWRQYASSFWDDIRGNQGDPRLDAGGVLPFRESRDEEDERHVHPLQLDVIRRCVVLRSNPGERVFTPFAGVGSEVYAAVELGRLGMGAELKPSYFRQALANLEALRAARPEQMELAP